MDARIMPCYPNVGGTDVWHPWDLTPQGHYHITYDRNAKRTYNTI